MRTTLTEDQAGDVSRQPNMEFSYDGLGRRSLRVTTDLQGGHVAYRDRHSTWYWDTTPLRASSPQRLVAEAALAAALQPAHALVEQP